MIILHKFSPVTIQLDTKEELQILLNVMRRVGKERWYGFGEQSTEAKFCEQIEKQLRINYSAEK